MNAFVKLRVAMLLYRLSASGGQWLLLGPTKAQIVQVKRIGYSGHAYPSNTNTDAFNYYGSAIFSLCADYVQSGAFAQQP